MQLSAIAKKLTADGLKNLQRYYNFIEWKSNYDFVTSEEGYWWQKRDSKSGQVFSTLEECEENALIHFCNTTII